jgi:hypothetical protein
VSCSCWGRRRCRRPPRKAARQTCDVGLFVYVCDVITFYSPEAVIMTSEDFAPQRGAMHKTL